MERENCGEIVLQARSDSSTADFLLEWVTSSLELNCYNEMFSPLGHIKYASGLGCKIDCYWVYFENEGKLSNCLQAV